MKVSQLLSLVTAVGGGIAASGSLGRRHTWEKSNKRVAICVDFDDAQAAAIRAGLSFDDMLGRMAANGATHVSLPELSLNRLLALGQLAPQAPADPRTDIAPVGHWNYVHGRAALISHLAAELKARLPYTDSCVWQESTLVFAGDLPTIGEVGLGFDGEMAARIQARGLGVVPRPVSYAWPEKALLERTLGQAGQLGRYVAFAGEMILGHEMHLDETLAAMTAENLSLVYFVESRHQKGDWFIAKRRAPHVILAHRMTPEEMVPLDFHAAAHNWAHLARERGIRLCYINFFRVLHATAPLEGLSYIHHLKHALEDAGFVVAAEVDLPMPIPTPDKRDLSLTGLAAAGVVAAATTRLLNLPEAVAVPLTAVAASGAVALPFVEQKLLHRPAAQGRDHHHHHHHHDDHHHDHDHDHEHHDHEQHHEHSHDQPDLHALYPPSYTPKLLGLAAAALGPVAAYAGDREAWGTGLLYQTAAAAALAAVSSGPEYQLRIEEYRGFNLDWALPLATAVATWPNRTIRLAALAAIAGGWAAARQGGLDPLARFDPGHAEGHTHHISAAMRMVGDVSMALGPQPARKWAGLGAAGNALSVVLRRNGRAELASLAAVAGAVGNMFSLVSLRRPERALATTAQEALPSLTIGTLVGVLLLLWPHDPNA